MNDLDLPPPKCAWLLAQQNKLIDLVANSNWQPSNPHDVPQEAFKAYLMMAASFLPGQRANITSSAINLALTYFISSNAQFRKDAEFTAMIKKLVNPAITQYESATVTAQLKGCQRQFENFYLHLDSLAKTPNVAGSELDTLDEFAAFATFHMMILRECVINRSAWGFLDSQIGIYINKFERCVVQYRAYILKWYSYGYEKVKDPIPADIYHADTWNRINYYRNTMITSVWDYVNLWWFMSPRDFPKPGISFERVRYLYTNIYGVPYDDVNGYQVPFQTIESHFELKHYHLYQNELLRIEYQRNNYRIATVRPVFYERGKGENNEFVHEWFGQPTWSPEDLDVRAEGYEAEYIRVHGTRFPRVNFAGNKIGNIAGIGFNEDSSLACLSYRQPIMDCISFGFIGNEVFSQNVIFSKITTCIDAQKYRTCGDDEGTSKETTFFAKDAMAPGHHGMTLFHPGVLLYEFDLEDPAVLEYRISILVAICTVEGTLMFCDPVSGVSVASIWVPVESERELFHLTPSFKFPGARLQDYAVKFSGRCVISSIIFTPYPLGPVVPAFPPPPKVKPTTPKNPATYTDKKQWMAVQQANTSYSVLTVKEFVPPDEFNPWNYYKIMICCALNFVPGYGPVLAGVTDIFLQYIIDTTTEDNTMARYRKMLKNLVDTNITLYDNKLVKAQYAGCAQSYRDFTLCVASLKKLPANSILRESTRISFMNLENDIVKYIYTSSKVGQQVEELMMFTLFATSHLTLLRECIINGLLWGFDPRTVATYRAKFYKHIIEYRNYAITTYYNGVTALKDKKLNSCKLYNALNEYRNMMISSVFDFVNIWFMFDPAIYWNVGITHERVRYLFSKTFGTPTRDAVEEIEADVSKYGYHQYQGDLVKVSSVHDDLANKFAMVYPTFTRNSKISDGTKLTKYVVSPPLEIKGEVNIDPKFPCTSVKVRYDYFPRELDFICPGGTNTESINCMPLEESGRESTKFSGYESDWYFATDNERFRGQGGVTGTAIMADHKLGNVFQLATEQRRAFRHNPLNEMAEGFVDGLVLAWLPTEIFQENYIEPDMITMVDCQKYLDKSADASFATDNFMPGVHAFLLPPGAWMEFEYIPRDPAVNQFSVMLRFNSKAGSSATFVNKEKVAETFTFGILVNDKAVFVPTAEKVVTMDASDKKNVYRLTNSGPQPFHIQSILFRPKGK
eukprot:gene15870-18859_t